MNLTNRLLYKHWVLGRQDFKGGRIETQVISFAKLRKTNVLF